MRKQIQLCLKLVAFFTLLIALLSSVAWPISYTWTIDIGHNKGWPHRISGSEVASITSKARSFFLHLTDGKLITWMYGQDFLPGKYHTGAATVTPPEGWNIHVSLRGVDRSTYQWHLEAVAQTSADRSFWSSLSLPKLVLFSWLTVLSLWAINRTINFFYRDLRLQTNLCLHCGYNLTGVESDKCPECGAERPLVTVSSQA
ncbi:hypothetical protein [Algisphaera agarilytica]|uniref:Uncharacterized protein n=1 Tax=Algisphaera agarilytica TaxID=1385975 RepID=A0A7X0H751_9BACT|nr:hypothetical protein [Algisphaera agarilytica]MBB6429069.1 hypothetical protein [Algisphaera agarilytica]